MKLKLGSNQKSILKSILWDYLEVNKGKAKVNKIIRREYAIVKGLQARLTGRRRTCRLCGQEIR